MPNYSYQCTLCGIKEERFYKLEDFSRFVHCKKCMGFMKVVIDQPVATEFFQPYYDPIQNQTFNTKKQFNDYCREKGLAQPDSTWIKNHREEAEHEAWKDTRLATQDK